MTTSKERELDLRKRLLQDIAELQTNPYPNITLHVDDEDITRACLILTPQHWRPLHLTVEFPTACQTGQLYPLQPPRVRMDSAIRHPNVFGSYICASILNTTEGYTPAYTLKAIAIQLLSFFGSDSVQQDYGAVVDLARYRDQSSYMLDEFKCSKCCFGQQTYQIQIALSPIAEFLVGPSPSSNTLIRPDCFFISLLPNEILLQITDYLDFQDLTNFTRSWSRMSQLVTNFNVIRKREMRCFLLKEDFLEQKLGIGIHLSGNGRYRELQSEFDLLSQKAYKNHFIRRSVQGLRFEHWLPLPISHGHWKRVQADTYNSLVQLSKETRIGDNALVIFAFMNNVIAKLNSDLESQASFRGDSRSSLLHASDKAIESYFHLFHLLLCLAAGPGGQKIVSYANNMIRTFMEGNTDKAFVPNLGNLLVALLISDIEPNEPLMRVIVKEAITRNVVWMLDGKGAGMAELAYLESDKACRYRLKKTYQASRVSYRILMFSELFRRTARPSLPKASGPPPAAKIESAPAVPATSPALVTASENRHQASPTKAPRLKKLWSHVAASKPATRSPPKSYSSVAAAKSSPLQTTPPNFSPEPPKRKSLTDLRDELFARHGAPPIGTAAALAAQVRRLQEIDDFPSFLKEMGVSWPGRETFTAVLRESVRDSANNGYHVWRPSLDLVAGLRILRDPGVDPLVLAKEIREAGYRVPGPEAIEEARRNGRFSFFPDRRRG